MHQQLLSRLRYSASAAELALLLAAVLFLERLQGRTTPVVPLLRDSDCLRDFSLFFEGLFELNARALLKQTTNSFMRVLSHRDGRDGALRLLAHVLDLTEVSLQKGNGIFD